MNTKTMAKAARELVPGEIFCLNSKRCVVVLFDRSARPTLHFALLGDSSALFEVVCGMDSQFEVELPAGLTPVQAKADELRDALQEARDKLESFDHFAGVASFVKQIDALLDELDPPKPPTLEEAIFALRQLVRLVGTAGQAEALSSARELLKRAPD